jgi:hypothetical protein
VNTLLDRFRVANISKMLKESKFFSLTILVILVLVAVVSIYFYVYKPKVLEPFNSHIDEYITDTETSTDSIHYSPYIRDKVIPVDAENRIVDDIYFSLPDELKPSGPEEVGTIIYIERIEIQVGQYTDGYGAYQDYWDITIVDKTALNIVDTVRIYGDKPPEKKQSSGPRTGTGPEKKVIEYLTKLARK